MELRRVADALLRSNVSSPLTTFLTPSLLPRSSRAVTLSTRRAISTTQSKRAGFLRPQTTSAATPRTSADNDTTTSKDRSSDSPPKTLSWASIGNERPQTSSESSPYGLGGSGTNEAQSRNFAMDGGTSATELLSAIAEKERAMRRRSGRNFDISQMMDPAGASESPSTIALGAYDDLATLGHLMPPKPIKVPMRLNPTAGRSVTLTPGIDLGRGIRLLEQSCSRNRIRRDFTKQRFHERPGLKRKRMKREGWRNRFADGFKAVVVRVKQLKKQGW